MSLDLPRTCAPVLPAIAAPGVEPALRAAAVPGAEAWAGADAFVGTLRALQADALPAPTLPLPPAAGEAPTGDAAVPLPSQAAGLPAALRVDLPVPVVPLVPAQTVMPSAAPAVERLPMPPPSLLPAASGPIADARAPAMPGAQGPTPPDAEALLPLGTEALLPPGTEALLPAAWTRAPGEPANAPPPAQADQASAPALPAPMPAPMPALAPAPATALAPRLAPPPVQPDAQPRGGSAPRAPSAAAARLAHEAGAGAGAAQAVAGAAVDAPARALQREAAPRAFTDALPAAEPPMPALRTAGEPPAAPGRFDDAPLVLKADPRQAPQPLLQALGDRLQLQIAARSEQAVIRLDPPQLGQIEIAIRQQAGELQVRIVASHGEVARQIQQHSEQLRHELVQRHSGEVSVQVAHGLRADSDPRSAARDGQPAQQSQAQQQQQQQQQSSPQHDRRPGLALEDEPARGGFAQRLMAATH